MQNKPTHVGGEIPWEYPGTKLTNSIQRLSLLVILSPPPPPPPPHTHTHTRTSYLRDFFKYSVCICLVQYIRSDEDSLTIFQTLC